ncbi:MAG TPA: nucleotidyltransferase domain-containing protein [Longimicrobium sp.]|jgi:predicted nucleotidyltransferase
MKAIPTSRASSLLESVFASGAMARLLVHFAVHPDDEVHVRELQRLTGMGMASLQAELRRLLRLGVLSRKTRGNRLMYRLETGHPRWQPLRTLIGLTAAPVELLRAAFAGVEGVEAAFVFGSEARGDAGPGSDVDLFILGRDDVHHAVGRALTEIELLLGREIDVMEYTPDRAIGRVRRGSVFFQRVAAEPRQWIAGDPSALERLRRAA